MSRSGDDLTFRTSLAVLGGIALACCAIVVLFRESPSTGPLDPAYLLQLEMETDSMKDRDATTTLRPRLDNARRNDATSQESTPKKSTPFALESQDSFREAIDLLDDNRRDQGQAPIFSQPAIPQRVIPERMPLISSQPKIRFRNSASE